MKKRNIVFFILVCFLLSSCNSNDIAPHDATVLTETNIDSTEKIETDVTVITDEKTYIDSIMGNISDFDLDSYEPNTYGAAVTYYTTMSVEFEEGDTVAVDELMLYYMNQEICDENWQIDQSLKQYETENYLELSIPKEIVHNGLLEHFALKIDSSYSKYTDPDNEGHYLLQAYGRGYDDIFMKDVSVVGNRVTGTFMYANLRLDTVYLEREICFDILGENEFRYIYVKDLFSLY